MTVRLQNHILHKLLMCIALVLSNSRRFRFEECRADLNKVIVWKQIDGKSGTELYIFPNNFHQLDYYGKQGIGIA